MSKEAMKLVPVEPTDEMLRAMDECSTEGYDERLYAGHAASVYMAAVDAAPTQPLRHEHAEQLAKLGWQYFECSACGFEGAKAFPKPAQPQQEPLTDAEIDTLREKHSEGRGAGWRFDFKGFARAIEAKLKEKNT